MLAARRTLPRVSREVGSATRVALGPSSLRAAELLAAQSELARAERGVVSTAVLHASGTSGSDVRALSRAPAVERAKHYQSIANLVRTLGIGKLPTIAVLDGSVTGAALGVGAHASACVVTERTRLSLPGPAYGFVPESFASYQLARLPGGLGAYLSLTGAALSGQELIELGLATHSTEYQAVHRIESEVGHQRVRRLGRSLRNLELACIEPRLATYTEAHALHFAAPIAEAFADAPDVDTIMTKLATGESAWHAQVLSALRRSSPLALALTHDGLRAAAAASCWTEALLTEASLCAAAAASPDCSAGAGRLEAAKRELMADAAARAPADDADDAEQMAEEMPEETPPAWEHANVSDVSAEVRRAYY